MNDTVLVVCKYNGKTIDLKVPIDIYADELVSILYDKLRPSKNNATFIRSENPRGLITGSIPLAYFGIHDGTIFHF